MDNMRFYTQLKNTPAEAKKPITEGKLKGKTDINPMHRIELMTKTFGPCGIGWKYEITDKTAIPVPDRQEMMCFVDILLYIKEGGDWSDPIPGTGGSMLVDNFRNAGIKSNDDGYKMALTDALGVAMKALGMSADVYYALGETKYNRPQGEPIQAPNAAPPKDPKPTDRKARIEALCKHHGITMQTFGDYLKALQDEGKVANKTTAKMTEAEFGVLISLVHSGLNASKSA